MYSSTSIVVAYAAIPLGHGTVRMLNATTVTCNCNTTHSGPLQLGPTSGTTFLVHLKRANFRDLAQLMARIAHHFDQPECTKSAAGKGKRQFFSVLSRLHFAFGEHLGSRLVDCPVVSRRLVSAMKRRPRGTDEGGRTSPNACGDGDRVADSEPAGEASTGQESPPARRGPGTATVTRERALYFATGQQSGPAASKKQRTADQQNKESWPGYFATARDLGENREAALAARHEEMMRREREQAGEQPADEEKIKWAPRRAPRKTVLTQHHVVPRLQDLALRCLAQHIELMPTLEYIDSTTRHRVARAVIKLRKMKTEGAVVLRSFSGDDA